MRRRAQEYEAKINSGDLIAIAEVVRDLFRSENQPEQSYSERQLYEAALEAFLQQGVHVETGVYGAHMRVHLVNDGPVTLFLDSEERFRPR